MDMRANSSQRSLGFTVTASLAVCISGLVVVGAGWTTGFVVGALGLIALLVADQLGVFAVDVDLGGSASLRIDAAERVSSRLEQIAAADRAVSAFRPAEDAPDAMPAERSDVAA